MVSVCSLMSSKVDTWRTLSCLKPQYPDSNHSWDPGFKMLDRCFSQPLCLAWWGCWHQHHLLRFSGCRVKKQFLLLNSLVPSALWLVEVQHGWGCEMATGPQSCVSLESLEETLQPQTSSIFNTNKGGKRGLRGKSKGECSAWVLKSQE